MKLKFRLFKFGLAVTKRMPSPFRTLHSFVWLHVLSVEDIEEITRQSYQGRTGFECQEHNLRAVWDWEEAAFRQAFAGCKSILVAGAGGGREMIALARDGHDVSGFDIASDLVDAGMANLEAAGVSGTILLTRPGDLSAVEGVFDALLVGRGVYHHIPRRQRRIAFLKACRERLPRGAPVVIDDFLTRKGRRPLTAFAISKAIEPGDAIAGSFFHYFTRGEIAAELEEAGFQLLDYRRSPFPNVDHLAHAIGRVAP